MWPGYVAYTLQGVLPVNNFKTLQLLVKLKTVFSHRNVFENKRFGSNTFYLRLQS